ncbi:MAG: hypothetical protein JWQ76_3171 [Ramlibacter sp.]|nr:hypothetical protein [Ramlibacter sp.]
MKLHHRLAALLAALVLSAAANAQALRSGDVTVEKDVTIRYVEGGDRNAATTLLFVPGWSTTTAIWRDQLAAFAPQVRVVAVDPRSQGFSTVTTHGNSPERRARDLREVIRALGLTKVVLVGWSQGVQDVAAYAAAFEGEQVAGYVLVDAAVSGGPEVATAHPADLKVQLGRMGLYTRYPREYLRGMLGAIIASAEGKGRVDEFVELGLRTPPDIGVGMLLVDFMLIDRRPALKKFNRPTLVIAATGADDLESQRAMAREIAGAQFELVPQAGHAVFLDQPAQFHRLLADFMNRIRG